MSVAVQIMDAIRHGKGNASKKDIQEATGIAWGTMCKGVDALLGGGYVFARREKAQGRGRPVIPLCVNSDAAYYVGLDIGAGFTRTVVCNLAFNTIYMNEVETPHYHGKEPFMAFLFDTVDTALRESRIERERLDGIGISVSGNVDFEDGVIVSGRNFGLPWNENVPVAAVLGDRYGVGVYAVTTQAAAPAAEYHFGTMAGCRNLLTLGFGVGIGSGVVSEGQLLISRPGRPVGHIGHMLISDNKRSASAVSAAVLKPIPEATPSSRSRTSVSRRAPISPMRGRSTLLRAQETRMRVQFWIPRRSTMRRVSPA